VAYEGDGVRVQPLRLAHTDTPPHTYAVFSMNMYVLGGVSEGVSYHVGDTPFLYIQAGS